MSLKTKRHVMQHEKESRAASAESAANKTVNAVIQAASNNKLLIGSIAVGCGGAIFLLTTDSGKRVRDGIQDRTMEFYDFVSDQLKSVLTQSRDIVNNIL